MASACLRSSKQCTSRHHIALQARLGLARRGGAGQNSAPQAWIGWAGRGPVRSGVAGRGTAGKARRGSAWLGSAAQARQAPQGEAGRGWAPQARHRRHGRRGMAWSGSAALSMARQARRGLARPGKDRHRRQGKARFGRARLGQSSQAGRGLAWPDAARPGRRAVAGLAALATVRRGRERPRFHSLTFFNHGSVQVPQWLACCWR